MTGIKEIEQAVHNRVGGTRAAVKESVTAVFDAIIGALSAGEVVKITGFGQFKPITRKARPGRNPSTGEPITIRESRNVVFKAGENLKGRL